MQDYVSTRWIRAAGLVAAIWVLWADFIPFDPPWPVLAWVGLAFSAAFWVRMSLPRSIAQVIADVDGEPVRAIALPAPTAVLLVDRKGMSR
jgi:hypothetical protein